MYMSSAVFRSSAGMLISRAWAAAAPVSVTIATEPNKIDLKTLE
jgi:hypothetical protein